MNQTKTTKTEVKNDYLSEAKSYLLSHLEENSIQFLKGLKFFFIISAIVYFALFLYYQKSYILLLYCLPFVFFTLFVCLFPFFYKKEQKKMINITLSICGFFIVTHICFFIFSDIYFYYTHPVFPFVFISIAGYLLANNKIFTFIFIGLVVFFIYLTWEIGFSHIFKTGNLNFKHSYPILFSFYFTLSYACIFFWIIYNISKTLYDLLDDIPNIIDMLRSALQSKQEDDKNKVILKSQLSLASKLQNMVLPKKKEELEISKSFSVDISGRMDPAEEVGGDYYDILIKGDELYMGIGDVTDHGMESGLIMLICQSSFKNSLYPSSIDIKNSLQKANKAVYEIGNERLDSGRTMSLSFAKYTKDGQFLLTGQHEKLIVCRQGKTIEWIETGDLGFIIGITDEIGDYVAEQPIKLEVGDSVLFYTDGANEAENEKKEQLGEEPIGELFLKYNSFSSKKILDLMYEDIYKFIGKQKVFDDITMLCLKRI